MSWAVALEMTGLVAAVLGIECDLAALGRMDASEKPFTGPRVDGGQRLINGWVLGQTGAQGKGRVCEFDPLLSVCAKSGGGSPPLMGMNLSAVNTHRRWVRGGREEPCGESDGAGGRCCPLADRMQCARVDPHSCFFERFPGRGAASGTQFIRVARSVVVFGVDPSTRKYPVAAHKPELRTATQIQHLWTGVRIAQEYD